MNITPQVNQQLPKNIVMSDMDDTLHEAEHHVMKETWNELLAPWNIVWMPTEHTNPDGQLVKEEERPGVGMRPLEVVQHFIKTYGLDPRTADRELLTTFGIQETIWEDMINQWDRLSEEMRLIRWSQVLEGARAQVPERIVQQLGVKEIPGAVDMMKKIRNEGYPIGIITSGSSKYAFQVLEKLGLIHYDGGRLIADIDVIVSGQMVQKPKPDPEPKELGEWIINDHLRAKWIDEEQKGDIMHVRPIAMFGDSNSDATLALNAGIPKVFIRESVHLSRDAMVEMQQRIGDRLTFVPDWRTFDPAVLQEIRLPTEEGLARGGIEQY